MAGFESKAESQGGQDSQIMSEYVEGFQQCVKQILNLIKQDENFSEMTPEFYDCKMSELTKLVMELWHKYEVLADLHVHSIKEVSSKTQHVDSSNNPSGGGFYIPKTEGLESSFTSSAGSGSITDSFISLHKDLISPLKNDATLKVEETKVHEPKVLLEKISTLEKEVFSLKKMKQSLTDEYALLEAEKSNMAELKLMISESNHRIKEMGKVLKAFRQKVFKTDKENLKLQYELSNQILDITHRLHKLEYMDQPGSSGTEIDSFEKQFDEEEEARNLKVDEKVSLGQADIAKRDEEFANLNTQINLLKISYSTKEDMWNTNIETLKTELREKCPLVEDLNQKHDALMTYTDALKQKVVELEEKWKRREM